MSIQNFAKSHKYMIIGLIFDLMDWGLIPVFGLPIVGDAAGDVVPGVAMMTSKVGGFKKYIGFLEFIPGLDFLPLWTIAGYFADKGGL